MSIFNNKILFFVTAFILLPLQTQAEKASEVPSSDINQLASPEEAKTLFNWAMIYLKINGKDAAYKAFN